jgi:drug/metabolite transporter (DMT)-like permease
MVNKDLVFMMYSGVPQGNKSNIFVRCLLKGVVTNIQLSIVKYLSLIFLAVTKQMTPITTIILSAFFFSTKILVKDILFCFIALIAVSFIIFGYTESK